MEPNMERPFLSFNKLLLYGGILAFLVIVLGCGLWFYTKTATVIPENVAETSELPLTASSTPITEYTIPKGWKTYTNQTFGFMFAYPPEYSLKEKGGTGKTLLEIEFFVNDENEKKRYDALPGNTTDSGMRAYYENLKTELPHLREFVPAKLTIGTYANLLVGSKFGGSFGKYDETTQEILYSDHTYRTPEKKQIYRFLCPEDKVGPNTIPAFLSVLGDGPILTTSKQIITDNGYVFRISQTDDDIPKMVVERGVAVANALSETLTLIGQTKPQTITCSTHKRFPDTPPIPNLILPGNNATTSVVGTTPISISFSAPLAKDIGILVSVSTKKDYFSGENSTISWSSSAQKITIQPATGHVWNDTVEKEGYIRIWYYRMFGDTLIFLDESFTDQSVLPIRTE